LIPWSINSARARCISVAPLRTVSAGPFRQATSRDSQHGAGMRGARFRHELRPLANQVYRI